MKRQTASKRGYGSKWQRESKTFLALPENHFCSCGCGQRANMVDHKIPHRGDMNLFWDRSNWQPMYNRHHSIKTAMHDGGFGNRCSDVVAVVFARGCDKSGKPIDPNHPWNTK